MDELVLQMILETMSAFFDAWQNGRVSRGYLLVSLISSVALPILAMTSPHPVVRALLWGSVAMAWITYPVLLMVGCRIDEKSPGRKPPGAQFDQSASDD